MRVIAIWPRGVMDMASDFESEDCEFESRRGRFGNHFVKDCTTAASMFFSSSFFNQKLLLE